MKTYILVIAFIAFVAETNGIQWNENWAMQCDWETDSFNTTLTTGENCYWDCKRTKGCTHFTWNMTNGGTCYLKKGKVCKSNAHHVDDPNTTCGLITPCTLPTHAIEWNDGKWAMRCDWNASETFKEVETKGKYCSSECVKTQGCTHYTWTDLNGGTCQLKKGKVCKTDAIPVHDQTSTCGLTDPKANCENFEQNDIHWNGNWAMACGFEGSDLSQTQVRGEECYWECRKTDGCTHFNWNMTNGGTCYLKEGRICKSDAVSLPDPNATCGLTDPKANCENFGQNDINWNGQNWAMQCAFEGNDFLEKQTRGQDCLWECKKTEGCTHFTWNKHNGGTCYMKTGKACKSSAVSVTHKTSVCGTIVPCLGEE